jgi:hypothetical protein
MNEATAAVAAHAAFFSIGIEINHAKIVGGIGFFNEHEPIGAHPEPTVANFCDLFGGGLPTHGSVVDDNKVVTGAVVFGEGDFLH